MSEETRREILGTVDDRGISAEIGEDGVRSFGRSFGLEEGEGEGGGGMGMGRQMGEGEEFGWTGIIGMVRLFT